MISTCPFRATSCSERFERVLGVSRVDYINDEGKRREFSCYAAIQLECPGHVEVLYKQDQVIMTRSYRTKQERFVAPRSTLAFLLRLLLARKLKCFAEARGDEI